MTKTRSAALEKGERVSLTAESVAFGGEGVGRCRDMVVFVPLMADGDEGVVEIIDVKKRYARGRLTTLTRPSPHRAEPRCPVYGLCGGCQYQHIAYEHQLALKRQQIHDTFSRIGQFGDVPLKDVLPSPSPWEYRQKADFHIQKRAHEDVVIGFTGPNSHDVRDIERCEIVDPGINRALERLRLKRDAWKGNGLDRRVVLWPEEAANGAKKGNISRSVKGRTLLVPRQGFFQANQYLTEALVDTVMDLCALTGTETVVDAFCGSGLFSIFLAPAARRFYGIEFAGDAVRAADANLIAAGSGHGLFYEGDVGAVLSGEFVKKRQQVDVLVLDPPRVGLGGQRSRCSPEDEACPHRLRFLQPGDHGQGRSYTRSGWIPAGDLAAHRHVPPDGPCRDCRAASFCGGHMLKIIFLFGAGIALFLFGMLKLSNSIQRLFTARIRAYIRYAVRRPVWGLLTGIIATIFFQSSSATSVIAVGMVSAGLIHFYNALAVILGADIGTTVIVQLVVWNMGDLSPLFIMLGGTLWALGKRHWQTTGEAVFYFGLLFFGLSLVGTAAEPLKSQPEVIRFFKETGNPIIGFLFSAVFTGLVHASAIPISILVILGQQDLVSLENALAHGHRRERRDSRDGPDGGNHGGYRRKKDGRIPLPVQGRRRAS